MNHSSGRFLSRSYIDTTNPQAKCFTWGFDFWHIYLFSLLKMERLQRIRLVQRSSKVESDTNRFPKSNQILIGTGLLALLTGYAQLCPVMSPFCFRYFVTSDLSGPFGTLLGHGNCQSTETICLQAPTPGANSLLPHF